MRRLAGQAALRAARLVHALAGLALAVALLAGAGLAALSWRLASGPLELPWLVRQIEAAANSGAGAPHWSIGRAALAWEGFSQGVDRPLDLRLEDVAAVNAGGITIARVPHLLVSLSIRQLLLGRIMPRAIELRGARLRIVRGADGALSIDLGDLPSADDATGATSLPDMLAEFARPAASDRTASRAELSQLQHLTVRDAALRIIDRRLETEWLAPSVTVDLHRAPRGGATGTADVQLRLGSQTATVALKAVLGNAEQGIRLEGSAGPINPARLAADVPALAAIGAADLPVSFAGTALLDPALKLRHAEATATLGAGRVAIAHGSVPLASATITAAGNAESVEVTRFAAALQPSTGPASLLEGTAALRRVGGMYTADATLAADRVAFATLADLWPDGVAGRGAKPWVTENITAGEARDLRMSVSLWAGEDFSDPKVTAIQGGFDAHDLTVHWLRPLPPMEHGEGRLSFTSPDEIQIAVRSGRQGNITVPSGLVRLTGLSVKDQLADIAAELDGPLADVIALLRQPKLQLLSRHPITMTDPSGQAHGRIEITRLPLEMWVTVDDIQLQATAKLTNARLGGIAAGRDLDQGMLDLTASNDGLKVTGTARIAGVPSKLQLDMDFRAGPPAQVVQTVAASATPDAKQLAAAGLDLTDYVTGPAPMELVWRSRRNGQGDIALKADLAPAVVAMPRLNFTKPAGRPAQAALTVQLEQDRIAAIDPLRVTGSGLDIDGRIGFSNGKLAVAQLTRAVLGPGTDLRADIRWPAQEGTPWQVTLSGASLDGSAEFGRAGPSSPKPLDKPSPGYIFDARLDRVVIGKNRTLSQVRLRAEYDGRITRSASLSGQTVPAGAGAAGGAFSLDIAPSPGGRALTGKAADAGGLLRALGVEEDMVGGTMTLSGTFDDRQGDHPLAGHAEITDFRMARAPALAKVLQAMTLYGLVETLRGSGLGFTRLEAPFRLASDTLELSDARAFNSSLGMTAKGKVDLARNRCDFSGTIVPAYFFNSLLGGIPLVGRLFSPERGGGLFAATYTVRGDCDDPAVSVNPLAALTPGFLRGLFGIFDSNGKPGTPPVPRDNPGGR